MPIPLKYKFTYSDKTTRVRYFNTEKEASWFAYNEGDHLIKYERLYDRKRTIRTKQQRT